MHEMNGRKFSHAPSRAFANTDPITLNGRSDRLERPSILRVDSGFSGIFLLLVVSVGPADKKNCSPKQARWHERHRARTSHYRRLRFRERGSSWPSFPFASAWPLSSSVANFGRRFAGQRAAVGNEGATSTRARNDRTVFRPPCRAEPKPQCESWCAKQLANVQSCWK